MEGILGRFRYACVLDVAQVVETPNVPRGLDEVKRKRPVSMQPFDAVKGKQ
ncbi:hypothetical protein [Azospirillum argentinense]